MATLRSEDTETTSSLEIRPRQNDSFRLQEEQLWQRIEIVLTSGSRKLDTSGLENVQLCRQPHDELRVLIDFLADLVSRKRREVVFEPADPSFELNFQTTHGDLIKVECWLDAGNGTTGFYTFDACGIRFCTTQDQLAAFVKELETEFAPPDAGIDV